MAKKRDAVVRISRKGFFIWAALILFISCWMFVLGILVGRGYAPINLSANKLEQELKDLKAAMAKKEQAKVEAHTGANGEDKPELGFYKALKENQGRQKMKRPPNKRVKPTPSPVPEKPTVAAKPTTAPKPAAKPAQVKKPAVKPLAKASPPANPTPSKGHFTIQVAAVKAAANAEKLVGDLRKKGYPAYHVRVTVPGKGAWHRVRVGAYENRAIAVQMLKKLAANKVSGIVINTK